MAIHFIKHSTLPPAQHLSGRQTNKRTLMDSTSQRQPFRPRPIVSTLNTLKLLHQSDSRVASFGERKLLSNADSRSAVERKVFLLVVSIQKQ